MTKHATVGMSRNNGRAIHYNEHIKQSVHIILTTPIGSRVMRRDFGSHVFDLIDSAMNDVGIQRLRAAIAQAIIKWEPRISISRVDIAPKADGGVDYHISARSVFGTFSIKNAISL